MRSNQPKSGVNYASIALAGLSLSLGACQTSTVVGVQEGVLDQKGKFAPTGQAVAVKVTGNWATGFEATFEREGYMQARNAFYNAVERNIDKTVDGKGVVNAITNEVFPMPTGGLQLVRVKINQDSVLKAFVQFATGVNKLAGAAAYTSFAANFKGFEGDNINLNNSSNSTSSSRSGASSFSTSDAKAGAEAKSWTENTGANKCTGPNGCD